MLAHVFRYLLKSPLVRSFCFGVVIVNLVRVLSHGVKVALVVEVLVRLVVDRECGVPVDEHNR